MSSYPPQSKEKEKKGTTFLEVLQKSHLRDRDSYAYNLQAAALSYKSREPIYTVKKQRDQ